MKKGKIPFLIVVSIFVVVIIGGFIAKSLMGEKPRVVVVLRTLDHEYWETIKAGVEKGFRDFGIDGEVITSPDGTKEGQIKLLEKVYKEKNPDVLIVAPEDLPDLIPTLERFSKEIPLILISANLDLKNKVSYVGTDNVDLGEKAGVFLASQLQPGDKVAIIGGDAAHTVFNDRISGAKVKLENAGIDVVVEERVLLDDAKTVNKTMTKVLRDYPDLKGVIATHDTMALNVINAIEEQGLNMPVTGADGTTDLIELIEADTIPGTVAQNPYDMGYLSVETALKVIKGESVEKFIDAGVDIIIKGNAEERLDFLNGILK
ncbi:sugar ABC transporter substrate-binding protein [Metabacillus rhizolycopersici]|uniref:Substrate-binding domain-containing protein n=1 Tax=Metabacillus rhizolycopersici TaxID=2875709 RepID=A0ABS7UT54_9BACI|nr:substrate-binding domain-containing protein [Metabacillus rhizolycopersici]MBZ5751232.1 substrate-binding domain-containing protein [Metabacillus rhizolycopersici]